MKKISYIFLVVLSMTLTSCSGEFWQGVALGGASFLSGMSSGYNVPTVANSFSGWGTGATYTGVSSYSGSTTSSVSSSSKSSSSSSSSSTSRHTCPLCHGSGTIIRDFNVATYGLDSKKYCSTCGKSYMASTGHSHITCTQCHGKGYF